MWSYGAFLALMFAGMFSWISCAVAAEMGSNCEITHKSVVILYLQRNFTDIIRTHAKNRSDTYSFSRTTTDPRYLANVYVQCAYTAAQRLHRFNNLLHIIYAPFSVDLCADHWQNVVWFRICEKRSWPWVPLLRKLERFTYISIAEYLLVHFTPM